MVEAVIGVAILIPLAGCAVGVVYAISTNRRIEDLMLHRNNLHLENNRAWGVVGDRNAENGRLRQENRELQERLKQVSAQTAMLFSQVNGVTVSAPSEGDDE